MWNNKGTQRRLLLQVDLTFDKAIEVALAAEAAGKDSRRLAAVTSSTMAPSSRAGPPRPQVVLSVTGVGGGTAPLAVLQGVRLSFL